MLIVQCAQGYVGWVFREASQKRRVAICTNDGFRIQYDPTPTQAWTQVVRDMVQHSVQLQGAFTNTHYIPL